MHFDVFWCKDNLSQAFYSSEFELRDWGGYLSWILSASALKMEGENRETGGDIQERCTIKVHLESSSNHCDFQTPVPPAPGRMQLAMDNFCEGNVAQSAMNDRTEPFLRCSDLRVISGCHLHRDTDDRKYVYIRRFAPLFIARLIF